MKHFKGFKRLSLSIVLCVLSAALLLTIAGCRKEPKSVYGVSEFKPGEHYVDFFYVEFVNSEGFGGSGDIKGEVFVKYPGADKKFHRWDTLRVVFDGADIITDPREHITNLVFKNKTEYTILKTVSVRRARDDEPRYLKPIIYFYPEEDTVCSVNIDINGELTCTYPEYGEDGWTGFTASKDGTLTFPDGKTYYALYWEGKGKEDAEFDLSRGFCVRGEDTADFLADILPKLGLSEREANEFIIYWLPVMQENPYNLITFQTEEYEKNAKLNISPEPDTVIRVFMVFKALDREVDIEAPEIQTPSREGFTVVEWGGSEIK